MNFCWTAASILLGTGSGFFQSKPMRFISLISPDLPYSMPNRNCQAACRFDHFWPLGRGLWFWFEWERKRSQGSELEFDGESFWAEGQGFEDVDALLSGRRDHGAQACEVGGALPGS